METISFQSGSKTFYFQVRRPEGKMSYITGLVCLEGHKGYAVGMKYLLQHLAQAIVAENSAMNFTKVILALNEIQFIYLKKEVDKLTK